MVHFKSVFIFAAFTVALAIPTHAFAWGCEGHQVVAYIAEHELNPTALSNANALLNEFPIGDLHRNCSAVGNTPMSDAATWADDVRLQRPDTSSWHFVDVPLDQAGNDPNGFCNNSCVLTAIANQLAIVQSSDPDSTEKAEALRYIIHFVGDVHQPLHASTDADRGGNCVPVSFDKKPRRSRGSYTPELHGIWDTQMVAELADTSGVNDAQSLAQLLDGEITPDERTSWITSTPSGWAIESTNFAVSTGYVGLMKADGTAATASDFLNSEVDSKCDAAKEKDLAAMGISATADYRSAAEVVIELRLKQAGIRLAKILNDTWPDETASMHSALHAAKP